MKKSSVVVPLLSLACVAGATVETPTMGWSSWNAFRVNISDKIIMDHADLLVKYGFDKVGYVYVNTDDGYFGGRDENGKLKTHPKRFPNGLKTMVDHIHGLGLKAGIYSDGGENTCGSIFDNDELGVGVGFWKHEQQDADYFFKELGFDFIKIDFCGGTDRGNSAKINMDPQERYTAIRQAVDRAKPGVRINVCRWNYPGTWVGSIGSSWRMSEDISPCWRSVNGIIHQNLYLSAYAGPGAFNDMDMLEVGRGMSEEEDKTHFGIWCMMSSPLLIGCDLRTLSSRPRELLQNTELIALNQDPVCQQAAVAKRVGETYVLVKDLETAHGLSRAVAFLNTTDAPLEMSVDLAKDLDLSGTVNVRDLFERRDLAPVQDGVLKASVPAHGTRLFRLRAAKRLERRVYEAETAWLSTYQELQEAESARTAYYKQDGTASGGVVASNVGGRPDNYLEWRDVWSQEGGIYDFSVETLHEGALPVVSVNGVEVEGKTLVLNKGRNVIRLANDKLRIAAIDRLVLHRREHDCCVSE